MDEQITIIDENTGEPVIDKVTSLPGFSYQNGYLLSIRDLGKHGVKIELLHQTDEAAVILPPTKAKQCAKWLLNTIGLKDHDPLTELPDILKRLIKHKQSGRVLKHGDKTKIKNAIKALRQGSYQN